MRYLDERVWVILNELRPLIDRQHIDITKWKIKKKLFMRPCEADNDETPWENFDSVKDRWYGRIHIIGFVPNLQFHSRWMESVCS